MISYVILHGAAITAISSAFYKQVPSLTKHPSDKLAVQSINIVNGKIVLVQGLPLVPFQIRGSIYRLSTYIVESLAYHVILGVDFLTYHNTTINFASNIFNATFYYSTINLAGFFGRPLRD